MTAYLEAHSVVQYQMPRSHTQRAPLESHRDSPGMLQTVPMAGRDVTVVHQGAGAVPPVARPPTLLPPVTMPPAEGAPPVTDALPPVGIRGAPPVALVQEAHMPFWH
jgi:hypothetical protein